ncbi:MAG TPA: sensor histidine kinase [Solirubrobacteraceae bacterium]|jgi:anti-sigma regulatory factor (Ser/Thr protein kinase)
MQAHQALFYRGSEEYLGGISAFIAPALERDEPVAIAVPMPKLTLLRTYLGGQAAQIELLDMCEFGKNPARIIPAVQAMIDRHGARPLHYVGEPIWSGRSPEEVREATRHEALINFAWPSGQIRILCPYDFASLADPVLADARHTHPGVVHDGRLTASEAYSGPTVPAGCEEALPDPPPESQARRFELDDLGQLRAWMSDQVRSAGVDEERAREVVTAANELTTNTVKHADTHGILRFWRTSDELIFQIEDSGHISDPLAGRRPRALGTGGLGLWMVNQLCDLVEVRTSAAGTTIRIHSRFAQSPGVRFGDGVGLAA